MRQSRAVERGDEYPPPDVSLAELEKMYRRERPGKSGDMLQAAVLRATIRWGRSAPPHSAR